MTNTRKYNFKDVEMLMATKTLINNFKAHKEAFVAIRPTWDDAFIEAFEKDVNEALTIYLGQEAKKGLRMATQKMLKIQDDALRDLSFFKLSLETDYVEDPVALKWTLTTLGFSSHFKLAKKKDQEGLIELLQRFSNNMTEELKAEVVNKGTSIKLIEDILKYASTMTTANSNQETHKGTSKVLTQTARTELSKIYIKSMAICKIGVKFFKKGDANRDKFVFRKLVSTLNTYNSKVEEPKSDESPIL